MKKIRIILSSIMFIALFQAIAMENQVAYPWYKNPQLREKVTKSWQQSKEFAQRHKGKIATAVVAGTVIGVGSYYGYQVKKLKNEIDGIYNKHGIDIQKDIKSHKLRLIALALDKQKLRGQLKSEEDLKNSLKEMQKKDQGKYNYGKDLYGPDYYPAYKEFAGLNK